MSVPPTFPDLAGKVAVVTGGSRGIGAATARMLAANGARVAVSARGQAGVDATVERLRARGAEAVGVSADCGDAAGVERLRERVEAELSPADVLIAFAGGFGSFARVQETTEAEWRAVIDGNLTATFLTVKAFLPGMLERRRGAIVTMASNAGRFLDMPLTSSYAAAKAGIVMFTRHLALEAAPQGVRANCVAPATVLSERVARLLSPERQAEVARMSPLGRMGVPDDVAVVACFLASDATSWMTGVTVDIAGGRIML